MSSGGAPVAPVGGSGSRLPLIVIGVLAGALALAIAKPWAGSPSGAASSPRTADARTTEPPPAISPPPGPSIADTVCHAETGWRLSTIETNNGRPIKTWYSVAPVAATGPSDPAMPTIRIYAESLQRLGYCAGLAAGLPVAVTSASGWRSSPVGTPAPIPLVRATEPGFDDSELGALFLPPPSVAGATPGDWPPGRYVFAVRTRPAPGDRLWFAAEVIAVGVRVTGPSVSPAPLP
jgi:hypothetical protein